MRFGTDTKLRARFLAWLRAPRFVGVLWLCVAGPAFGQSNYAIQPQSFAPQPTTTTSEMPAIVPNAFSYAQNYGTSVPDSGQIQSGPVLAIPPSIEVIEVPSQTVAPTSTTPEVATKQWWIPLPEGIFPPITGQTSEEHRFLGPGTPLLGPLSWSKYSHTAGFYGGGLDGAQTVNMHLTHQWGSTFGLRFGVDYDYHWGVEKRFGFASMETRDKQTQIKDQTELEFGDIDLYFYPWGDSRWRPFIMGGVGLSRYNHERSHEHIEQYMFTSPFGIGVKRLVNNGFNVRVEIADNLMLGSGVVGTINNMSIAAGAEFRYKGLRWLRSRP